MDSTTLRLLSWDDFDRAVQQIAACCAGRRFTGIHGIPRGGLCLAVALSHRLELPLLPDARPGCLLVDDVYETGLTLEAHRQLPEAQAVVWISKAEPQWWLAAEVTSAADWIVFPWEDPEAAARDERLYRASRGGTPC
jgi:hypoxanthine phosphoribosyltransferase